LDIVRFAAQGFNILIRTEAGHDMTVVTLNPRAISRGFQVQVPAEDEHLAMIDIIPDLVWSCLPDGTTVFLNRRWLDYTGLSLVEGLGWGWMTAIHPEDLEKLMDTWQALLATGQAGEEEARLRRHDGEYRWFLFRATPLRDKDGKVVKWFGTNTDIEGHKRAEAALQQSEERFRLIIDSIPGLICSMTPAGEFEIVNRQILEYFGKTPQQLKDWATTDAIHPDDLLRVIEAWRRSVETGEPYDIQHRIRRADGVYRWFHVRGHAVLAPEGCIVRWYLLVTDIEDRKKADDKHRRDEEELRRMTDAIATFIHVLRPDGTALYANQTVLDHTGLTLEDVQREDYRVRVFHPEDVERLCEECREALTGNLPFENEQRVLGKDGKYRWFLVRYHPLRDEQGKVLRWYATATDIEDRKQKEERTRNENLALREEIARSSMSEEIVGTSSILRQTLSQVSKVAPTESTVLILGETGTGKELIARAIHKRSKRSSRAFVRVNCAAIPQSLIASELFGHEKGAFTGAIQRRVGRFEAADGGTIFLDEVGDLPPESQIALLRVLQEREIERVGSNRPIPVDVRIVTATNRDLNAEVAAGTFRQDLFFRLNVFPINVPSLRERKDDIPLLVEYLIDRYATKSGKKIRTINKQTLDLFQEYNWPGNVRELQNVIERAVILCEGDHFEVDATWLRPESPKRTESTESLLSTVAEREKEIIEAALKETLGRVSGPAGAAAKLGIPRQTLESKIRAFGIKKSDFKSLYR
jgi:formate hydrogenlyase transcriptional activator